MPVNLPTTDSAEPMPSRAAWNLLNQLLELCLPEDLQNAVRRESYLTQPDTTSQHSFATLEDLLIAPFPAPLLENLEISVGQEGETIQRAALLRSAAILADSGILTLQGTVKPGLLADENLALLGLERAEEAQSKGVTLRRSYARQRIPQVTFCFLGGAPPKGLFLISGFMLAGGQRAVQETIAALIKTGLDMDLIQVPKEKPTEPLPEKVTYDVSFFPDRGETCATFSLLPNMAAFRERLKTGGYAVFYNMGFFTFEALPPGVIGLRQEFFPIFLTHQESRNVSDFLALDISSYSTLYRHTIAPCPATVVVLPHSAPEPQDKTALWTRKQAEGPLFLFLGRISNYAIISKRPDLTIVSFAEAVLAGKLPPNARLLVAGAGADVRSVKECEELRDQYNAQVRERFGMGLEPIAVETDISEERRLDLLKRATALLTVSGYCGFGEKPEVSEHLGLSVLDALAYGVIPIVRDPCGAAKYLRYGRTGFIVPPAPDEVTRSLVGEAMEEIAASFGTPTHQTMVAEALELADRFSFEYYTLQLVGAIASRSVGLFQDPFKAVPTRPAEAPVTEGVALQSLSLFLEACGAVVAGYEYRVRQLGPLYRLLRSGSTLDSTKRAQREETLDSYLRTCKLDMAHPRIRHYRDEAIRLLQRIGEIEAEETGLEQRTRAFGGSESLARVCVALLSPRNNPVVAALLRKKGK